MRLTETDENTKILAFAYVMVMKKVNPNWFEQSLISFKNYALKKGVLNKIPEHYPEANFAQSLYKNYYDRCFAGDRHNFAATVREIFCFFAINTNQFINAVDELKNPKFNKGFCTLYRAAISAYCTIACRTASELKLRIESFFEYCEKKLGFGNPIIDNSLYQAIMPKTPSGVLTISETLDMPTFNANDYTAKHYSEEKTMSNVLPAYQDQPVSNPTLIFGRPKEDWTEEDLIKKIRELRKEQKSNEDLVEVSERFRAKNLKLEESIKSLVEILDSLE